MDGLRRYQGQESALLRKDGSMDAGQREEFDRQWRDAKRDGAAGYTRQTSRAGEAPTEYRRGTLGSAPDVDWAHRRVTFTNVSLGIRDAEVCITCHHVLDEPEDWPEDGPEWHYPFVQVPWPCEARVEIDRLRAAEARVRGVCDRWRDECGYGEDDRSRVEILTALEG